MDIPAYISSGILESYLLGLTAPEETKEVESLARQYPAIRIELNKIEDAINDYASLYSQTPPANVRDKIFASVDAKYIASPTVKNETKVVSINKSQSSSSSSGFKWLAAAASVALLVSAGYNYQQHKDLEAQKTANDIVAEDINNLNVKFDKQFAETERIRKNLDVLTKPGTKMIEMKGLDKSPSSLALIYWNQNSKEVFINIQSLPQPPADKQYQLWAIVDGAPVDIGVFDILNDKLTIQKMKEVQNPQAFAVTLEKKGGSPTPTMEEMYVMGKNG
ncbi:MAG: anti-sigma factor [Bacteroidia bacterium]